MRAIMAIIIITALALIVGIAPMRAQTDWPNRPVRIVVPSAAGGYDVYARMLAPLLSQRFGQSFIIENRAGAAGNLGMTEVARAAPDGYTLLFAASNAMAINSSVYRSMPVDPIADFDPVAIPASSPFVWVTHPRSGITSLHDVIARARAAPGKLDYASPGNGTMNNLIVEAFKQRHKLVITPIVYNGTPPAQNDVVAGHVPFMTDTVGVAANHIAEGRFVALAVATKARSEKLPDVPTTVELGLEDREFVGWYAFGFPKGTPPAIVARLADAIDAAIQDPSVDARVRALGATPRRTRPEELRPFMIAEREKFRAIVEAAGLKVD